jgi:AcrR family transcriptional regulator
VPTRRYEAPRREEQAAATRTAIVEAAARLFAERGYEATTMSAIASAARVAPKTVYTLGDKARLLRLALDRAIAGDDDPVPLADRPALQAVFTAGSGQEAARSAAAAGAPMLLRLYPLYRAFEQAAATDPQIAEQWREYQDRRREDVREVVSAVQQIAPLRPGLDTEQAIDTLWALVGWHPVALLVEHRGWGRGDVQRWLEDVFTALLLGTASRPPSPTPPVECDGAVDAAP